MNSINIDDIEVLTGLCLVGGGGGDDDGEAGGLADGVCCSFCSLDAEEEDNVEEAFICSLPAVDVDGIVYYYRLLSIVAKKYVRCECVLVCVIS